MVSSVKCFRPEDFAELTTPSAPYKGGFAAAFSMSRPPLLFKEGKIRGRNLHFFNSWVYSYWSAVRPEDTRDVFLLTPQSQFDEGDD